MDAIDFLCDTAPLPPEVTERARLCLLDLVGVGWGGAVLPLSQIVRDHAALDMPGGVPLPFDTRYSTPMGVALATGMTIDALDGHDGCNATKGHAGCGLLAGLLAWPDDALTADDIIDALARGYEVATRVGMTQHATCPDYHTSGAWVAVAVAGLWGRLMGLAPEGLTHAMGIAEYHGPRSQMMRCIDHPTMVKDGSGYGAMAGVQAAQLAARGFTGGPAITLQGAAWADLGQHWLIHAQYFKPYPVCRWAQAPIEAALSLRPQLSGQIEEIVIETFHESIRLAVAQPTTTEEAQYSTSFPVAVALARGGIGPRDVSGAALSDPEILRLSRLTTFREDAEANAAFPLTRLARARITAGGKTHVSDWHRPRWDAEAPPSEDDLIAKAMEMTDGILPDARRNRLAHDLWGMETLGDLRRLMRP